MHIDSAPGFSSLKSPIRSRVIRVPFTIVSLFLIMLFLVPDAQARRRFEEGDWVAWPDSRTYTAFEVGKNTVYFATTNGILRWNRVDERWKNPWFSVPGPLEEAIFLTNPLQIKEDPLTQDVWIELKDGWVYRDNTSHYWEYRTPQESTLERLNRDPLTIIDPEPGLIEPYQYVVHLDDQSLHYRNQEWDYAGGVSTPWRKDLYAWTGYGIGLLDKYSPVLDLYPQGAGPSPGLVVTDSVIWSAGTMDNDGGWLWKMDRKDDNRWQFFDPRIVWGLEPGDVQSMTVDQDGTLWIATNKGLMYGNGEVFRYLRKTDKLPSERISDVQPMKNGAWIATLHGLAFIVKETGQVIRPDKEKEPDAALRMWNQLAAYEDTLYASGPGFLMMHEHGKSWTEIDVPTTIGAGSDPMALWAERGYIAIGDRQGIAWRTPKGEWKQAFNNLWDEGYVFDIDYHGGYFWLGTDRGLVKYDPTQGDAILYTSKDGLPGNVVYEVHGEGKVIWMGTDVGLARFRWDVPGRLD